MTPTGQVHLCVCPPPSPVRAHDAPYPASPSAGATATAAAATPGGRGLHSPGDAAKSWPNVPLSAPPGRKAGVSGRWRAQLQDQPAARSIRFRFCFSPRGCREVRSGDRSVTQHPHPCLEEAPAARSDIPSSERLLLYPRPPKRGALTCPSRRSPFRSLSLSSRQRQTPLLPLCGFVCTPDCSLVHLSPALASGPNSVIRIAVFRVSLQTALRLTVHARSVSPSLGDCGGVAPVRPFWADGRFYTQVTFLLPCVLCSKKGAPPACSGADND